jgi:ribonuclease Y
VSKILDIFNPNTIGPVLISVICGAAFGFLVNYRLSKSRIRQSEETAQKILTEAQTQAKSISKEASLQARDILYQSKVEFEKETKERRMELQKLERRLIQKEENLDKKVDLLDNKEMNISKREKGLIQKEREFENQSRNLDRLIEEQTKRLEGLAGISSLQAKEELIKSIEADAKHSAAGLLKKIEEETRLSADKKSKEIIAQAIQRYSSDYVSEKTVSVVNLPNDEMKGRIIGREGRNIRTLESATGVDLIIDDTPEAVILSGYNPIRREIARVSLERLITDGRIHPARIEEIVDKVSQEIDTSIREAGEQATFDVGVHGIHSELIRLIGTLKYRTSYAQNVLQHSLEVAFLCGIMASELRLNAKQAKRVGLLHDIGKALDYEFEGSHAIIGAEQAKKFGEAPRIVNAILSHHNEETPQSVMAILVQAADALSAARPGARREMLETYVKRLEELERIANSFSGVDKSYAIQAGRELRIIVESEKMSDEDSVMLSYDISKKIEKEVTYPGQIKVTVIRETRAIEYAK